MSVEDERVSRLLGNGGLLEIESVVWQGKLQMFGRYTNRTGAIYIVVGPHSGSAPMLEEIEGKMRKIDT